MKNCKISLLKSGRVRLRLDLTPNELIAVCRALRLEGQHNEEAANVYADVRDTARTFTDSAAVKVLVE